MPAVAITLESYLPRFCPYLFRTGQREVITAVLAGQDCLCVMPTGGGKSLCYQLPAIAQDGLTLVVSPLIALMKDQVDQLQALGLPANFINSALPAAEQYTRLDRMAAGEFRLVYVCRAVSQWAVPRRGPGGAAPACWRSTRPIASASGGMIFAPTMPDSAISAACWATRLPSR